MFNLVAVLPNVLSLFLDLKQTLFPPIQAVERFQNKRPFYRVLICN